MILGEKEDMEYFRKKLFTALEFPKAEKVGDFVV